MLKEKPIYVMCLFKIEGHETWRMINGAKLEDVEKQLINNNPKTKVTQKRFYEIDRLTGAIEEF